MLAQSSDKAIISLSQLHQIVKKPPQVNTKSLQLHKKSLQIQPKIISVHMVQFDEFKLRDLIPFLSKKFPSLMKQMRQKQEDCTNK